MLNGNGTIGTGIHGQFGIQLNLHNTIKITILENGLILKPFMITMTHLPIMMIKKVMLCIS